ncbi:hypothetical protein ABVK25_007993 [Lepraria finkii]|uniref:Uncharacterized protein n=1 Tax=Lepraria finkii TaxID=1340010 RepID=A0ABR4B1Q6_9LECA
MQNPNSIIPLMSPLRIEADLSTPFRATLGPLTRGGLSRGPVTLKTLLLAPSVRCFPTFLDTHQRVLLQRTPRPKYPSKQLCPKKIPPKPYITDETTSPSPSHPHHYQNGKDKRPDPTRKSAHHPRRKEEAPRGDQSKASRDPEGSAREEGEGEEGMIDTHSTLSLSLKSGVGS